MENELNEIYDLESEIDNTISIIDRLEATVVNTPLSTTALILNVNRSNIDIEFNLGLDLLDIEDINPLVKYNRDTEGVESFLNKLGVILDKLLLKYQNFVRKIFFKILNKLSFRKDTIDKLIEDLPTEASSKEMSLDLSVKLCMVVRDVYQPYKVESLINVDRVIETFKKSAKDYEKGMEKGTFLLKEEAKKTVISILHKGSEDKVRALLKEKIDTNEIEILVRLDKYIYVIIAKENGSTERVRISGNCRKRIKHGSAKDMESMLIQAREANENFNETINDVYSTLGDIEDIELRVKDIGGKDLTDKIVRDFATNYYRTMKVSVPWMTFHSAMHTYNHIGYTISVAKEFSKDVK